MSEIRQTSGHLDGSSRRFAIVAARFNGRLVEALVDGAVDCLQRHGVAPEDIHLVRVPGAWEIPDALSAVAAEKPDAMVALGIVIRGETPHFDYVCGRCSAGVAAVSDRTGIPVGFGVLTCDTPAQAQERAGGKAGNKGWEAAAAALEMADLRHRLRSS
ncbi:MAG: 6,7-dimethyl-8-ribityllumazine synthase [Acidobacteria bacterium]|nr:6,7-dimethyl-8-ribityllumazine synthase [Acidobacteriota bacterium]